MIENVLLDYSMSFDQDWNMVTCYGDIQAVLSEDSNEFVSVGTIYFHYYNVYELGSMLNVLISADSVSGDEEYIIATLMEENFEIEYGGKLITLDRIVLNEDYASENIEYLVLKEFLEYCRYMSFDYVAVIASEPIKKGCDEPSIITFPRMKLYRDFHFQLLGGSQPSAPVMVKNLNVVD